MTRPTVLVIAGSDSSAGAGIVRDMRVLAEFHACTRCVVTAVTAQTDTRVLAVHVVPAQVVEDQVRAAFEAGPVDAIKIGMLGGRATVEAIARHLPSQNRIPIVLDPVLASSSGQPLMDVSGAAALRELLFPLITLVTPNLPEAARLLDEEPVTDEKAVIEQAIRIQRLGARAVLLKGGHGTGAEAVDVLISKNDPPLCLRGPRLNTAARGTGCALSSAISVLLAHRLPLSTACERAKDFVLRHVLQPSSQ
jgi:hydroxymethylpyrimidine/phosphomethylpyrimidine kinase